jgi:hypothetical protein
MYIYTTQHTRLVTARERNSRRVCAKAISSGSIARGQVYRAQGPSDRMQPCRHLGSDDQADIMFNQGYNAALAHGRAARIRHGTVHRPLHGTRAVGYLVRPVKVRPDLFDDHHRVLCWRSGRDCRIAVGHVGYYELRGIHRKSGCWSWEEGSVVAVCRRCAGLTECGARGEIRQPRYRVLGDVRQKGCKE